MTLKHTITYNIASDSAGDLSLCMLLRGFRQSFQETTLMLLVNDFEGLTRQR